MTVRVRVFAALRELLGQDECVMDVDAGTTVETVWEALCAQHPALAPFAASVSFAVNREYVAADHRLSAPVEIAIIPPVSGG